jgi:hypothetical protein
LQLLVILLLLLLPNHWQAGCMCSIDPSGNAAFICFIDATRPVAMSHKLGREE